MRNNNKSRSRSSFSRSSNNSKYNDRSRSSCNNINRAKVVTPVVKAATERT